MSYELQVIRISISANSRELADMGISVGMERALMCLFARIST